MGSASIIGVEGLDALIHLLVDRGYRTIGPRLVDGAVRLTDITGVADLPRGVTDEQTPGRYRTTRSDSGALFDWAVGPDSARRYLDPPKRTLVTIRRRPDPQGRARLDVAEPDPEATPPVALIGLRGCDVAGLAITHRVLAEGTHPDPFTATAMGRAMVVAVECSSPASTCFCTSMGTGPGVGRGADVVLTELDGPEGHRFVVRADTDRGSELVAALVELAPVAKAAEADLTAAKAVVQSAADAITRTLPVDGLADALLDAVDGPGWDEVAERCLSCANCTLVCPTCFCGDVVDHSDLAGVEAGRDRVWDSCFTSTHSYLHGGSVRSGTASRYRQWITHKLSTWHEQFGTPGCVGCGRCIAWCPVGIDLVDEAVRLSGVTQ